MTQTFLFAPTADAAFLDPEQCDTIANTVLSDCCPMLADCDKHSAYSTMQNKNQLSHSPVLSMHDAVALRPVSRSHLPVRPSLQIHPTTTTTHTRSNAKCKSYAGPGGRGVAKGRTQNAARAAPAQTAVHHTANVFKRLCHASTNIQYPGRKSFHPQAHSHPYNYPCSNAILQDAPDAAHWSAAMECCPIIQALSTEYFHATHCIHPQLSL